MEVCLIDRNEALDVLDEALEPSPEMWNLIRMVLRELPFIKRCELPTVAYWKESTCLDDSFWVCSNCQFPSEAIAAPVLYHYCPHCGARMEDVPYDGN